MNPKMLIAARWMLTDRELRPFLWRPVLLGIGLYALLLAVSLATILPWGMAVLRAWGWPDWLAILAFGYGWLMGSGVMLTTLIVMVSGPQFDRLSRLIEVRMGRVPVEIPRRNAGRDNLARMAFSFLGGFVVMLSGVCLPVVGPLLLGGHLAWVDLTGPA
ncbi:MAG: hypothetical protein SFX74_12670, partial [Fimbriimonadaceae bacterium]|nr:hypothetical protein [Fimbriimonadaceae bacterium]